MVYLFDDFSNVPDPATDPRLLPRLFHNLDNQEEREYCKVALQYAMESLEPELRDLLYLVYWKEEQKGDIAIRFQVSPSTITRRLTRAEGELKDYLGFALDTFRNFQHQQREYLN